MRGAAWIRLGLKVYAFVFITILVYLGLRWFREDLWLFGLALQSNPSLLTRVFWTFILHCCILTLPFLSLLIIAMQLLARVASDEDDDEDYTLVSWLIFVASAEWLWRFLARLLVSSWQLLVDVFDADRWWDAAAQGTIFFGSFFAYCMFTVALRSIKLEGVEYRELAQLRRERRQVDADQNAA